jgi:hypothetical protein
MKNIIVIILFVFGSITVSNAQAWMTSLDVAQDLAAVQNKMVLMVWEDTTNYEYPVLVNDTNGRTLLIENLFEDEAISPLIWKHFVPVIVNEDQYADLFLKIKGKRKQSYIDKFNDDSIKIMDINGNILNSSTHFVNYQNITTIIQNYGLTTEFVSNELQGYKINKDFYSTYFLASKYLDFSMYVKKDVRAEVINLSQIYLEEAEELISLNPSEDQLKLSQRAVLLKIQANLITSSARKVLRQLNRMDAENVEENNLSFVAFLYYTAYSILDDDTNAEQWKSQISSVNLKKAQLLINLNS